MIEFSTCYELSELNIDLAINKLKQKFEILELDMFCNALSEYNKSGNIIEILDNLQLNRLFSSGGIYLYAVYILFNKLLLMITIL